MPEETADPPAEPATIDLDEITQDRDRLQDELDAIANRALDRWLSVEQYESAAVASMQQTLSWRVTRPLRAVREAQLRRRPGGGRGTTR